MPRIPASERDAYYESRRSELAQVALELWAERGFDQTSVHAIAEAAGIAKGTFYLYFDSKEALLEDVFRRNSLLPLIRDLVEELQHAPLEDAVRGFVRGAWRHLREHRELVLILMRELPTHLEKAQELVERLMIPASEVLAGYLESHVDPERADRLALPLAARGLVGSVLFTFITQDILGAQRVQPMSEEAVSSTLAEVFLHGVMRAVVKGEGSSDAEAAR